MFIFIRILLRQMGDVDTGNPYIAITLQFKFDI